MAGALTLGGAVSGPSGTTVIGPNTVAGKRVIIEVREVTLEANVDFALKIPTEAVQWAAIFQTTASAVEVKIGSNLRAPSTEGMPILAQGHVSLPLHSSVTEIKFRAATAPAAFFVYFCV